MVFAWEEKQAVLVNATVCLINTRLADEIRALIESRTGISADQVILAATHTHTGPNTGGAVGWGDIDRAYCDGILVPRILEAVEEAAKVMTPVRVGIATGESHIGINRRQLMDENTVKLGQNPWGPYNPKMTVISFKDEGDKVVANMVHYGLHCTAAGHYTAISRDWSGVMCFSTDRRGTWVPGSPTAGPSAPMA